MKREIKFRAWDMKLKQFYIYGFPPECYEDFLHVCSSHEIEWQQYTGLKDKHGKEIYEGDIIQNASMIGSVDWHEERAAWILADTKHYNRYLNENFVFGRVIGNIYQHPELLTTEPTK